MITTIAGGDWVFTGDGKPALNAALGSPSALAFDPAGNLVLVDSSNCVVARVQADGILSVIAGNGICDLSSGDNGPATSAAIGQANAIAYDTNGNLYIGEYAQIRMVSPAGIITRFAGTGAGGYSGDGGPASKAQFGTVTGITIDASGTVYFADLASTVRKITPDGIISTVAGNGKSGNSGDGGPATAASLQAPRAVAVDKTGKIYIADYLNGRIRMVSPDGTIATVFPGLSASGLAISNDGTLYIGSYGAVYQVPPGSPIPVLIAGNTAFRVGFAGDGGPPKNALLSNLTFALPDSYGNILVADQTNGRVRLISAGVITTIAGNGAYRNATEGAPANATPLFSPDGLAIALSGAVYFTEPSNNRVRKVADGIITTVAGTGQPGDSGDGGPANQANVDFPLALALDTRDNLYIAGQSRVRRVTPPGIITTFVSQSGPWGLAFDPAGALYVANNTGTIAKVDPAGNSKIVAGARGDGFSGDGGPASSAMFRSPRGLSTDAAGSLYIADYLNNRVRKISPDGNINTVAGGGSGSVRGGPATQASLNNPGSIASDAAGNVFIAELGAIDKLTPDGNLFRIAGGGPSDQLGDGKISTAVGLGLIEDIKLDAAGNLYFSDVKNSRVRVMLANPPAVQVDQQRLTFSAASGGAPVTHPITVQGSLAGLDFQVSVLTTTGGKWLSADANAGATPRLVSISADPSNLDPGTYTGTVSIIAAAAKPSPIIIPVTFTIGSALLPKLNVDVPNLSFGFSQDAPARSAVIKLSNIGGGTLNVAQSVATDTGGAWLSVPPVSGPIQPGKPLALTVSADPSGLKPGTYTGRVVIDGGAAGSFTIPVNMMISRLSKALLLTQSGMTFTAVSRGGIVPPQTFGVLNTGLQTLNWTASTSTLAGGEWLRTTAGTTASSAGLTAPEVMVSVDPSGLDAGNYYGLVSVDAPDAANTPQVITVFLQVLEAGSNPGAVVQPSELVFTLPAGGGAPGSQVLSLYNVGASPKSYRTGTSGTPGSLVYVQPQLGTLDPLRPAKVVVQPTGPYNGALTFEFDDGRVQTVKITSTSAPAASSPVAHLKTSAPAGDGVCTPKKLMPALTTLGSSFTVSGGWPVALSADVRDDCGNPHISGSVTVDFSNGDPSITMESLNNGRWQGTWPTGTSKLSGVTVTVTAINDDIQISGVRQIDGSLSSDKDPPSSSQDSIVSTANHASYRPLALGGIISISGDRLAEDVEAAQGVPSPAKLGNARVIIGDQQAPLFYASQNVINAFVPPGLNPNTQHYQIRIQRGLTYSQPIPVDIGQPAAFSVEGSPLAFALRRGGPAFLVSPANPAQAGDLLTLYCSALDLSGQTNTASPSPFVPADDSTAVTVTIGDKTANISSAGFVPGAIGMYQVNLVMPDGVPPGDSQTLTVTIAGQNSPPASLAVR